MNYIELGMLAMLSISNSPYPKKFTVLPGAKVHFQVWKGFDVESSMLIRCAPSKLHRWNPTAIKLNSSVGWSGYGWKLRAGHESGHAIRRRDRFEESYDYGHIGYRWEIK